MEQKKICLISSSGGHFEQLKMLENLKYSYNVFFVTEKTKYSKPDENTSFILQINRKELFWIFKFIINFYKSWRIFLREKPDIIISTGALSVIPMFIIGKLTCRKTIFIESFAKTSSPTLTGKLLYRIADDFIIQWKTMKEVYPNAIYLGSIY